MQCYQFHDRLNELLDQRQAPEADLILLRHAECCDSCHAVLETQRELFECLRHRRPTNSGLDNRRTHRLPFSRVVTGVAAALLLIVTARQPHIEPVTTTSKPSIDDGVAQRSAASTQRSASPSPGWASVIQGNLTGLLSQDAQLADQVWLDQVSGGIRPLTNSMNSTFNVLKRTWPVGSRKTSNDPQA